MSPVQERAADVARQGAGGVVTFLLLLAAVALLVFAVVFRLLQVRRNRRINPPYFTTGGPMPEFLDMPLGQAWPVNPNRRSHR